MEVIFQTKGIHFKICNTENIVSKPLCYHASNLGLIPCVGYNNRSPYCAARPTQPSILQGPVNEYQIIPGLSTRVDWLNETSVPVSTVG